MTIIVPPYMLFAGNWNTNDFPTPVPVRARFSLLCFMMASNIDSCNPRNRVSLPNICFNSAWMSPLPPHQLRVLHLLLVHLALPQPLIPAP